MEMRGNDHPPFALPEAAKGSRKIRIIDGHYNLQFTVDDRGWIVVDGKPYQVHYIDETHFRINRQYFHICQFGETVIDRGSIVEKMAEA